MKWPVACLNNYDINSIIIIYFVPWKGSAISLWKQLQQPNQTETSHFYDSCIFWKCVEQTGSFLLVGACTENKVLNEDHRNKKVSWQETVSWLLKSAVESQQYKIQGSFPLKVVLYSSVLFGILSVVLLLLTGRKQISYLISSHWDILITLWWSIVYHEGRLSMG